MNKKLVWIIVLALLVIPMVSAATCTDEVAYDTLPCDVITPVINCTEYNATVMNIDNASFNYSTAMLPVGDGTYTFEFNYTEIGGYSIVICDNSSSTINIVYSFSIEERNYWLYVFVLLTALTFYLLGKYLTDDAFPIISGMLLCVLAIHFIINGYPNLTNEFLRNSVFFILLGIGLYLIANHSIKYAQGGFK